jgi:hypothetical protein
LKTNASGKLAIPLPYGTYTICADDGARSAKVSVTNDKPSRPNGNTAPTILIPTKNSAVCS